MFGILNINKPAGVTSRDVVTKVVQVVKKATGTKVKAGHAGTLDPIATGVLIVCIGKATRLIQYVQRQLKKYVGKFQLDVTSESADIETQLVPLTSPANPTHADFLSSIPNFVGVIKQKPPAYSAISIDGRKAYKLARQGIEFEIEPKDVNIESIEIRSFEYPLLDLEIECGTGTYIRSLGQDLARSVNSDAVMMELERTSIGEFQVEDALAFDLIDYPQIEAALISPTCAVRDLPQVQIDSAQQVLLANGRFVAAEELGLDRNTIPDELAALDDDQNLVAILEPRDGELKSKFNLGQS